jgi:hypothetical protein
MKTTILRSSLAALACAAVLAFASPSIEGRQRSSTGRQQGYRFGEREL